VQIESNLVGVKLRPHKVQVDSRLTTNYAAAVGDANPAYLDDQQTGGIVAPPMFAVAATWPVAGKIWEYLETDRFPLEILATQVHYSEHLTFHRPVKPGDTLTISGQIAAIVEHRAGTHVVIRFEAVDTKGSPVFTEHIGAMMRGVKCVGDQQGAEMLPEAPERSESPEPIWEASVPIDPLAPYVYDGCTDIVFPIHTSPAFATQVGLPGIILQGTATLALAARELLNREAGAEPRKLAALSCRFGGMVAPGTDIRVRLTGRRDAHLFFEVRNSAGEPAIKGGWATLVD
jgi:acyl dehydratase